ncbi:MAG TPA: hypothetical protein VLJ40_03535 [Arthrobacter sp.]|nr:hypothetical protein [Arthrobacter sp.]
MRPGLAVRRAGAGDIGRPAEVHVQCWQETYRGMLSDGFLAAVGPEDRLRLWRHLLQRPDPAEAWVAAGNSRAIGFYRRFGFEPDAAQDVLPDWENLPEIRMVRPAQRFQ